MALPRFFSAIIPDSLAPSLQQNMFLLAFFFVIALAARFYIMNISGFQQIRVPSGLATFARFFYASFLKTHSGDGAITGQQAALESFYKAQVAFSFPTYLSHLNKSRATFLCHSSSRRRALSFIV